MRKGTAKYEFRQYTIIGPESTPAAKAALAASEQNRYWNYIELFYRNQGTENSGYVTDDFLRVDRQGRRRPDIEKWNQDRESSKWDAVLTKVQSETLPRHQRDADDHGRGARRQQGGRVRRTPAERRSSRRSSR